MGMTIDEAIRYYENKNVVLTEEEALANTIAIETLRKYQKIEQIYSDYLKYMNPDNLADRIGEVVEDGNVD